MNRCEDCCYWERGTVSGKPMMSGVCELLSGPGLLDAPRRAMTTAPNGTYAIVRTARDFGCADFSPAEPELKETVPE